MKRLPLIAFFILPLAVTAQLQLVDLRCMYTTAPMGVETMRPFFSWKMQGNTPDLYQTAYRILVSEDSGLLRLNKNIYWDSKKQNGSSSVQVYYDGKPLQAAKKYFWKLVVWDNKGRVAQSNISTWQMGLPQAKDWGAARWIGYDEITDSMRIAPHVHQSGKKSWGPRLNVLPLLRREWNIDKPVQRAVVFISGLGHFDMFVNGQKTGDHFLDPGWTDYDKQAQYLVFDITSQLRQGNNVIGVMLGNGFYYIPGQRYRKMTGAYGHPKMIMKAIITYKDGSQAELISDQQWQAAPSPITYSSIFGGEDYDANREQSGWNSPGFAATGWRPAILTQGPPRLRAQLQAPLKIMERFQAKTKRPIGKNEWLYDLGQNFSGIPSIRVKGHQGDTIRIYCAELINKDGTANQKATGSPSYFTYILKGEETASWQPQFTYTGFRYMQVQCIAKDSTQAAPVVEEIAGWHTRNAAATVGSFSCSNQLFNDTYKLIDWAIRSNTVSLFTDCPHREKLGWLEQTHLMGASVQYNYDVASLNRKVILDMMDAQYPNGKIPEIAPELTVFTAPFDESPEWGSASLILPWYHYQWYGDREILSTAYPMMKAYVDYLLTKDSMLILQHGLGDWFDIGPGRPGVSQMTKKGITATATLYYDLTILTQVANKLWQDKDAAHYKQLAAEVKKAFNAAFFDPEKKQYDSASQTANAMALYMGLVEPANKEAVVNALVNDIKKRNNALTAGDIGFRYVLKALEVAGHNELIFDMNNRDDVPGYGFQLKHGATALTESWQAYESVSNNHFMLGHLMEWFYSSLAGIRQSRGSVGYQQLEFRPQPVGDIRFVSASIQTMYGEVKSSWTREAGLFTLEIVVPVNTRAAVYLPGKQQPILTGSGKHTFKTKLYWMNVLICEQPGQLAYGQREKPLPEKGRAILQVKRIGICGTDLHAFEGTQPFFSYPRILGHELAAVVEAVEPGHGFAAGDQVSIIPYFNCGKCIACRNGLPNCCAAISVFGVHADGGMCEYISVPVEYLLKGNDMSFDELALIEPVAIGAHGVRRAGVHPGEFVLVIGAGPIGLGVIEMARIEGAKVIAMDINEGRLDFCREKLQVSYTINAAATDVMQQLQEITGKDMPTVVIDATGNLKAINNALQYLAHGGRYVLVGLQKEAFSFSHPEFHKRETTLMSSRNATRIDFEKVMQAMRDKKVKPATYITHRVRFEEVRDHFESWLDPQNGVIKAMVEY